MPKASPIRGDFTGGELTPLMYGRVDSERYKVGLGTCLNYIPMIQGGLARRPGTMYVAAAANSALKIRLIPFEFSVTQAYVLELGNNYMRFYLNDGQLQSGGSPYQIATPWGTADLFAIKFCQSADVLYMVHPNYPPYKLIRLGATNWTLTQVVFIDGPYLDQNTTATTLTFANISGSSYSCTASSATGINQNNVGFQAGDVGRLIRGLNPTGPVWSQMVITAVANTTHCTVTALVSTPTAGSGGTTWRLGVWSTNTGFPNACTFYQNRLYLAGCKNTPQRFDASQTSNFETFSPTDLAGNVTDDDALSFNLVSNDVNMIQWMSSTEQGLLMGSISSEWLITANGSPTGVTPTRVSADQCTQYGSANIQPVQVGKATVFIQRSTRKARELQYWYYVGGFLAPDLTVTAEHLTKVGLTQIAFQKEPQPIIWCVRSDGALVAMTYERDLDALKAAWSRHVVGGASDAGGTQAIVESVAVIPSPDQTRDEVWLSVQRWVNGAVVRTIEVMTQFFDATVLQEDAFFVDCGLTYDAPVTMTGVSNANPTVVTAPAHGFTNGMTVLINDVVGMTFADSPNIPDNTGANATDFPDYTSFINDKLYVVQGVTTNTFTLKDTQGNNIDSTLWGSYVSGGTVRKLVTTITGLDYLDGQSVSILADGAVQPDQTVVAGAITLTTPAATVNIGLGYNSDGQLLRLEAGAADGTALGKTRRTHRVGIMLDRSLGLELGTNFDELDTITFRTSADRMSRAPALFSGIISETLPSDYDFENQICWRQSQPLPSTILAILPQMVTQDRE